MAELEKDPAEDKELSLIKQIARTSFRISARFTAVDNDEVRLSLNTALTILSQALLIVKDDSKYARRLFELAKKIGRI